MNSLEMTTFKLQLMDLHATLAKIEAAAPDGVPQLGMYFRTLPGLIKMVDLLLISEELHQPAIEMLHDTLELAFLLDTYLLGEVENADFDDNQEFKKLINRIWLDLVAVVKAFAD